MNTFVMLLESVVFFHQIVQGIVPRDGRHEGGQTDYSGRISGTIVEFRSGCFRLWNVP
jgi:hypothetical protein